MQDLENKRLRKEIIADLSSHAQLFDRILLLLYDNRCLKRQNFVTKSAKFGWNDIRSGFGANARAKRN